jgi:DNA-binding MarR family transcriptional regulator
MTPATPAATLDHTELAAELRLALVPLVRQLRQQAGPDLTPSLASALVTVAKDGPVTLGELACKEHVSQPMISKIAATLVEEGLASKVQDPTDRRVFRLEITADGRRKLDRSRTRKNAWLAKQLRKLDADDLAAVQAVIPILDRLTSEAR